MSPSTKIPAGVRVVKSLFNSTPFLSVSRMDDRALRRAQTSEIPSGPIPNLLFGRPDPRVHISVWHFDGPAGPISVRVYQPKQAKGSHPLIINLHGGGFVLGSARQGDWLNSTVAAGVGAVVVAPDYRLAPTAKFPAALEDCWAAIEWAVDNVGEWDADPERIAIMGDSAGGNLAAVATMMARDAGGPNFRHQVLIYPAGDVSDAARRTSSWASNTDPILLSNEDLDVFRNHYLPEDLDRTDWRVSPTLASDHSGLPPATVVVASLDPLRDSGVAYAQALVNAGVPVRVEEFHRMPHGFLTFPNLCKDARPAAAVVVKALRSALEPSAD
jgi:acetyl esterase